MTQVSSEDLDGELTKSHRAEQKLSRKAKLAIVAGLGAPVAMLGLPEAAAAQPDPANGLDYAAAKTTRIGVANGSATGDSGTESNQVEPKYSDANQVGRSYSNRDRRPPSQTNVPPPDLKGILQATGGAASDLSGFMLSAEPYGTAGANLQPIGAVSGGSGSESGVKTRPTATATGKARPGDTIANLDDVATVINNGGKIQSNKVGDTELHTITNHTQTPVFEILTQPDPHNGQQTATIKNLKTGQWGKPEPIENTKIEPQPQPTGPSIHTTLTYAGLAGPLGPIADIANAALYALERNPTQAAFSIIAATPITGDLAQIGKLSHQTARNLLPKDPQLSRTITERTETLAAGAVAAAALITVTPTAKNITLNGTPTTTTPQTTTTPGRPATTPQTTTTPGRPATPTKPHTNPKPHTPKAETTNPAEGFQPAAQTTTTTTQPPDQTPKPTIIHNTTNPTDPNTTNPDPTEDTPGKTSTTSHADPLAAAVEEVAAAQQRAAEAATNGEPLRGPAIDLSFAKAELARLESLGDGGDDAGSDEHSRSQRKRVATLARYEVARTIKPADAIPPPKPDKFFKTVEAAAENLGAAVARIPLEPKVYLGEEIERVGAKLGKAKRAVNIDQRYASEEGDPLTEIRLQANRGRVELVEVYKRELTRLKNQLRGLGPQKRSEATGTSDQSAAGLPTLPLPERELGTLSTSHRTSVALANYERAAATAETARKEAEAASKNGDTLAGALLKYAFAEQRRLGSAVELARPGNKETASDPTTLDSGTQGQTDLSRIRQANAAQNRLDKALQEAVRTGRPDLDKIARAAHRAKVAAEAGTGLDPKASLRAEIEKAQRRVARRGQALQGARTNSRRHAKNPDTDGTHKQHAANAAAQLAAEIAELER